MKISFIKVMVKQLWSLFYNWLFPNKCILCNNTDVFTSGTFCSDCFAKITIIEEPICIKCGKLFTTGMPFNTLCNECNTEDNKEIENKYIKFNEYFTKDNNCNSEILSDEYNKKLNRDDKSYENKNEVKYKENKYCGGKEYNLYCKEKNNYKSNIECKEDEIYRNGKCNIECKTNHYYWNEAEDNIKKNEEKVYENKEKYIESKEKEVYESKAENVTNEKYKSKEKYNNNVKSGRLFEKARSLLLYDNASQKIVLEIKKHADENIAHACCELLFNKYSQLFENIDFIVPVPSHWIRTLYRGFNPADIIARELSIITGIQVSKSLRRIKYTAYQHKKSKAVRLKNLKNAFVCKNMELCNKNVLLVDDVFSTGATLNECTKTLLQSGVKSVKCATIASTSADYYCNKY